LKIKRKNIIFKTYIETLLYETHETKILIGITLSGIIFIVKVLKIRHQEKPILGRNIGKVLKSFSPCHSQSPLQLCLEISISSNLRNLFTVSTVHLLYIVKEKGGKPDRKPYPLPFGLRNSYRNLKSENSQDYAQNPQRNYTFVNSASG
jgi:hypothetical protein